MQRPASPKRKPKAIERKFEVCEKTDKRCERCERCEKLEDWEFGNGQATDIL